MTEFQERARTLVHDPSLGYDQRLRRLAALATDALPYPALSDACREALDKRVICDLFEGNAQEETNLHNFYTYQFEAVYYTVAFAAFVVLPWAWLAGLSRVLPTAAIFVPPWYFALAACPVAGFLYEEWNLVPYQVWFAGALLIALHLTSASEREATMQRLGMAVVAVMVVAQLAFLANGHEMLDGFELSEIRELVIAVSIAAYAMIVLGRFRERAAGRA